MRAGDGPAEDVQRCREAKVFKPKAESVFCVCETDAAVRPALNQVEMHPYLTQTTFLSFMCVVLCVHETFGCLTPSLHAPLQHCRSAFLRKRARALAQRHCTSRRFSHRFLAARYRLLRLARPIRRAPSRHPLSPPITTSPSGDSVLNEPVVTRIAQRLERSPAQVP